jgi:arylsulfatase A-like enzyme
MGFGDVSINNPDSKISTPNIDRIGKEGINFTNAHAPSSVCTPSRYAILTGEYCWRTELQRGVLWSWDKPLIKEDKLTVPALLKKQGYKTACFGKWHLGWDWQTTDGRTNKELLDEQELKPGKFDIPKRYEIGRQIDFTKRVGGGPVDRGFDYYFGGDVPNFPPYTWFENDSIVMQPTEEKPEEMFGAAGPMFPGWKLEEQMPEVVKRANKYIVENDDTPFFLYLPLTGPHTPIVPLKEFEGLSGAGRYGDFVVEIDWLVGTVLDTLDKKGITDNTIVIFTTDNGPEKEIGDQDPGAYNRIKKHNHYSMHIYRGIKRDAWEGGHRVPFLLRWPACAEKGAVCDQLITLGDLLATAADITGVEISEGEAIDSVSMVPLLSQETMNIPTRAYAVHHSCSGKFALRKGDWLFIDASSGDDNKEPQWFRDERGIKDYSCPGELFNLKDDPGETTNLYIKKPDIVKEMKDILTKIKGGASQAISDAPVEELSE